MGVKDWVGKHREELHTPSLVVDIDVFRRNASLVAGEIRANGVVWRPHIKSHRSPVLAQIQLDLGASGITCGTVGEAQGFVAAGFRDILIANVVASPAKWSAVARLQTQAEVIVCVDDSHHVRLATEAGRRDEVQIPIYLEMDVGLRRTGVHDPDRVYGLAEEIARSEWLRLVGLMGYEGHCMNEWPLSAKEQACSDAISKLVKTRDELIARGISVDVVSCGGTGTFEIVSRLDGVTEIQAGGGCLMDVLYEEVFHVKSLEFALTVETEVVSRPHNEVVIVDAGLKAVATHGEVRPRVRQDSNLEVVRLSAEHGTLRSSNGGIRSAIGDRLSLIPGRIDTTIFLYDLMFAVEDERVVDVLQLVRTQV